MLVADRMTLSILLASSYCSLGDIASLEGRNSPIAQSGTTKGKESLTIGTQLFSSQDDGSFYSLLPLQLAKVALIGVGLEPMNCNASWW